MKQNKELYNKIEMLLYENKIKKTCVAGELGVSLTAFSLQLKRLRDGNSIGSSTLFVIEKLTGGKIFFNKYFLKVLDEIY